MSKKSKLLTRKPRNSKTNIMSRSEPVIGTITAEQFLRGWRREDIKPLQK